MKNDDISVTKNYFMAIKEAISTSLVGAKLTFRHLKNAIISPRRNPSNVSDNQYFKNSFSIETLQYPKEKLPVPDVGRYKLHNEIDDCIVCDKCAKICPVNCIDIEAIKSPEVIGETSDGTQKRLYAAKFDIDMAKCCFCGLCTTVCPTECLTMTKDYEFSQIDVTKLNFQFSDLSTEEVTQKKKEYETHMANKASQKANVEKETLKVETKTSDTEENKSVSTSKPAFKPKFAPKIAPPTENNVEKTNPITESASIKTETSSEQVVQNEPKEEVKSASAKPVFKPKIPVKKVENVESEVTASTPLKVEENKEESKEEKPLDTPKTISSKPVFKPKIPPIKKQEE
jgi:NADH-quinone oxidoreductase subunit I